MRMAAKMPMMAMTVRSSISVNPTSLFELRRTGPVERRMVRRIVEGDTAGKTSRRSDSFSEKSPAQADFPRPELDKTFFAPLACSDEDLSRWQVRRRARGEGLRVRSRPALWRRRLRGHPAVSRQCLPAGRALRAP